MIDLALALALMLIFVVSEALVLQWIKREPVNWREVVFNLNAGHIMLWLSRSIEIFCFGFVAAHFSLGWVQTWPAVWMWLFAIVAWDFGFYWLHRLHHHFGALWAVHVVHHQGEHFNLSLGVRNSWYSSLTSIPFFLFLAVLGVPLYVFVTVSVVHYSMQLFNHNALTPPLGWLEKVLVTPAHHRVHHVNDRAYADTNFGGTFIVWDKLFGTFCPQLPTTPFRYGMGKSTHTTNPLWANNLPVLAYLRLPIERLFKKRLPVQFQASALALTTGASALFALVVGYISLYGNGYTPGNTAQVVLFVLLAAGTIALGAISEGQRWGLYAWLCITALLAGLFLGYWHWQGLYWKAFMMALVLHSLAMLAGWGRRPTTAADLPPSAAP